MSMEWLFEQNCGRKPPWFAFALPVVRRDGSLCSAASSCVGLLDCSLIPLAEFWVSPATAGVSLSIGLLERFRR